MRHRVLFPALLLLASCATIQPAPPPGPGSEPSYVAIRQYLAANRQLAEVRTADAPVAFVMLQPGKTNVGKKICKAFGKLPTKNEAGTGRVPIPTYWPASGGTMDGDCKDMVAKYDWARRTELEALSELSPNRSGLLVLDPDRAKSFFIDLGTASDKQREKALRDWAAIASSVDSDGTKMTSRKLFSRLAAAVCSGNEEGNITVTDVRKTLMAGSPEAIGLAVVLKGGDWACAHFA